MGESRPKPASWLIAALNKRAQEKPRPEPEEEPEPAECGT